MLHFCSAGSIQRVVHCWGSAGISQSTTGPPCISPRTPPGSLPSHPGPPPIHRAGEAWAAQPSAGCSTSGTDVSSYHCVEGTSGENCRLFRGINQLLEGSGGWVFFNQKKKSLFSMNVFETKVLAVITTRGTMGEAAGRWSAESWGLSGFNTTNELYEYSWFLYLCTHCQSCKQARVAARKHGS